VKRHVNMSFWMRLRWLLRLWVLLVTTIFISTATFAYDKQNETKATYDERRECATDYGVVWVLTNGEKKNASTGDRVPFAKFDEFLAADTGGKGVSQ
jgi:hypothetical protein